MLSHRVFLRQAGVGDPTDDPRVESILNYVVLISGDLLTGERIRSLLESRSEGATPWRRIQFVVYVHGIASHEDGVGGCNLADHYSSEQSYDVLMQIV
jgi:hypothetical protein